MAYFQTQRLDRISSPAKTVMLVLAFVVYACALLALFVVMLPIGLVQSAFFATDAGEDEDRLD